MTIRWLRLLVTINKSRSYGLEKDKENKTICPYRRVAYILETRGNGEFSPLGVSERGFSLCGYGNGRRHAVELDGIFVVVDPLQGRAQACHCHNAVSKIHRRHTKKMLKCNQTNAITHGASLRLGVPPSLEPQAPLRYGTQVSWMAGSVPRARFLRPFAQTMSP